MTSPARQRLGARIRRDAIRALVEMHGPEFRRYLRAAYGHRERPPDWRARDAWYGKVRAEAERVLIAAHRPEYARLRAVGYKVEEVKAKARPWIQSPLMASVDCTPRVADRRERVAELVALGWTAQEIAWDLAVDHRTIMRDKAALGLTRKSA